ncbi:MAG: hypothetical protein SGBAC_009605 [Bacillariaceae sp.]
MKSIILIVCFLCYTKAQSNGTCNPIKDKTSCESAGCHFCSDADKCRVAASRCPGGGGSGGNNSNASEEGTCNPVQEQAFCEELGCFYCAEASKCRVSEDRCPVADADEDADADSDGNSDPVEGSVTNGLCNPIKNQNSCETSGCFFCTDKNKCRISEARCPGSVAVGLEDNVKCNPIGDATACGDAGCFFCQDKGLCRATEEKCPGISSSSGSSLCKSFKGNEAGCSDAGCFFCSGSSAQCQLNEAECPGQGRSNPCVNLEEADCSTSENCLWCVEGSVCTTARGGTCSAAGVPPGNQCKQFSTDTDCTMGETSNCRWCPTNSKCKNADDACDDGDEGIRGNPCKNELSTDGCTAIEGCLWCEGNSKCKKAEDGCGGDGNDVDEEALDCGSLTFEPDCVGEQATCQWCVEQQTCAPAVGLCGTPIAAVALDIEYGSPTFTLKNAGLGETDPNAVKVALNYLFEVAEDGTEIPFSFVDVHNQGFKVSQTEGLSLGVLSRRATFKANIVGVGSMELIVYKILEDGTLTTPSGETFEVTKGDVKFNVNLSEWSFCDEDESGICADSGSAAYVDIAMTVQGSAASPEQDATDGSVFSLGGGVPLILSNQVEIDGVIDAMPPGFPRVEETPAQGIFFVFRFPRFANTLVYDPIVGSGTLIVSSDGTLAPATLAPLSGPTEAPAVGTTPPTTSPVAGSDPTLAPVGPTAAPVVGTTPSISPVVGPTTADFDPTPAPISGLWPTEAPAVTTPTPVDSGANALTLLMSLVVLILAASWL